MKLMEGWKLWRPRVSVWVVKEKEKGVLASGECLGWVCVVFIFIFLNNLELWQLDQFVNF